MLKTILILSILLPAVIYSQPDYLRKDHKSNSKNSLSDNDPELLKKYHVKSVTRWDASEYQKKTKIDVTEYDLNGNMTSWTTFDKSGKKVISLTYEYNINSLLIQITTTHYNGYPELNSIETFSYDDKNRIVRYTMQNKTRPGYAVYEYNDIANATTTLEFDKDNKIIGKTENFYNDNGYLIKNTTLDISNNTTTEYFYYAGYVEVITTLKDKSQIRNRIIYNDNNKITERSEIGEDSLVHIKYSAEYNLSGKKLKETGFDDTGKETYRYEWKHDDNGNAVEEDYFEFGYVRQNKEIFEYNENGLIIVKAQDNMVSDLKNDRTVYTYEYY